MVDEEEECLARALLGRKKRASLVRISSPGKHAEGVTSSTEERATSPRHGCFADETEGEDGGGVWTGPAVGPK